MLEIIRNFDGNLLIAIQDIFVNDIFTPVVKVITHLGDKGVLWILLIILMLCFKKTRKTGILAAISLATTFIVVNLFLKNAVSRARPYEIFDAVRLLIEKQSDASFPSGHAANSFAVATIMFTELPKKYGVPAITLAAMIALSRLYVGVHYPLDVLCGIIIGVEVALIVRYIDRKITEKRGLIK